MGTEPPIFYTARGNLIHGLLMRLNKLPGAGQSGAALEGRLKSGKGGKMPVVIEKINPPLLTFLHGLILFFLASSFSLSVQAERDVTAAIPANNLVTQAPIIWSLNNPMRPLAISPNGEWVMYGDGTQKLHRVSTKTQQESPVLTLPASPMSISLSRSGQRALVTTVCDGVGTIDFSGTAPVISWIVLPHNGCTWNLGSYSFKYKPAAISPDGEMFADYAYVEKVGKIRIFSTRDNKPLLDLPFAERGRLLQLEFLPGNRFLLIIEARSLGERGAILPWNTVYSLWDIESKQLRSSAKIRTAYEPSPNALLGMSHFSGEGWAIRQTIATDNPEFVRFPLRGCSTTPGAPNALNLAGMSVQPSMLRLAADSFGRWLALGRSVTSTPGKTEVRHVVEFFDVSSTAQPSLTKPVAILFGTGEISQMRASLDGTTLWATLVDGSLERFDVPREALNLATARADPVKNYCAPADESPEARQIDSSMPSNTARKVYEKSMYDKPISYTPITDIDARNSCPRRFASSYRPEIVGLADGTLMIDIGMELLILDPVTGNDIQRIPAPRSAGACAMALHNSRAFLIYQGDTLEMQPWSRERRTLVSKPGWKVALIGGGFSGEYQSIIYVNWKQNSADADSHGAPGIAAAYSLKTGELIREEAATYCKRTDYPVVSCDRSVVKLSADDLKTYGEPQEYTASIDDYKSLIVRHVETPGETGTVIFRQGVSGDVPADQPVIQVAVEKKSKKATRLIAPYYLHGFVLNDHLVLGIKGTSADLYDYRSRKLVATLNESNLDSDIEPIWHEPSGTLWIVNRYYVLQGWRIEKSDMK
jgi:hypothetical protein